MRSKPSAVVRVVYSIVWSNGAQQGISTILSSNIFPSSQSTQQHLQPTQLYKHFKQHFSKQAKMKVSQVAAVLAVTASASAAPWKDGKSWGGHWKGGWKNGHEEKCMDGPFEFTSTYSVVATPDQVVDSNNNPTGGLAVSIDRCVLEEESANTRM